MSTSQYLISIPGVDALPLSVQVLFLSVAFIASTIAITHLFTSLRYYYQINQLQDYAEKGTKVTVTPPRIPYSVPGLGHAFWFLDPFKLRTGQFWRDLMRYIPRKSGSCTIQLGPDETHVLFDPLAIETLMKMRTLNRDKFNMQVSENVLSTSKDDIRRFYGVDEHETTVDDRGETVAIRHLQDVHLAEFLLNGSAVKELTADFVKFIEIAIKESPEFHAMQASGPQDIPLARYLRQIMFKGSINALYGTKILEVYPEFEQDYWTFDEYILHFFFVPTPFIRQKLAIKDRCIAGLQRWLEQMKEETSGVPEDPRGPVGWEPRYGSRLGRARQIFHENRKLSSHGAAASMLGVIFALESNAIPTAQWMLTHIINADSEMRQRIMAEIKASESPDGSLDTNKLCGMPLLQSAFTESMRLYTDVLVARNLPHDVVLPMSDSNTEIRFTKGTTIFAPSWLGHRDENSWEDAETWRADRFVVPDEKSDDPDAVKFSMTGTNGKYFPFGGGKTMCPGRVFARHEVISAVASVLHAFDVEVLRFVEDDGHQRASFPGLKPALTGTAGLAMTGDTLVRMSPRKLVA